MPVHRRASHQLSWATTFTPCSPMVRALPTTLCVPSHVLTSSPIAPGTTTALVCSMPHRLRTQSRRVWAAPVLERSTVAAIKPKQPPRAATASHAQGTLRSSASDGHLLSSTGKRYTNGVSFGRVKTGRAQPSWPQSPADDFGGMQVRVRSPKPRRKRREAAVAARRPATSPMRLQGNEIATLSMDDLDDGWAFRTSSGAATRRSRAPTPAMRGWSRALQKKKAR